MSKEDIRDPQHMIQRVRDLRVSIQAKKAETEARAARKIELES